MSELISVVIPIYKVENYLRRCVDSILNQSYKNLEIILVDDGSPDKCGEICDSYEKFDERVKVIHKKNGGLSEARNAGIDIAQGDYISFIDSDDWVHEVYIERLYQLLKKSKTDISVCNFIKTASENVIVNLSEGKVYEYSNIDALRLLTGELYVQMVIACGKLYKRILFEDIRFPTGKLHEDEFTTYKLIYKAKKVIYTTEQLLYYWQREDSIMGVGFNLNSRLDILDAFKERADFFKRNGLTDLSNNTYKSLFYIYVIVYRKIKEFGLDNEKVKFDEKFKELRGLLRTGNHKFIFKVFFELYYIMPKTATRFYSAYFKK